PDYSADKFFFNKELDHSWCMRFHILPRFVDRGIHRVKDMQTSFSCLLQCLAHYVHAQAIYFYIHLYTANAITGTCHFKIHITEVIFITKYIRQYCKLSILADQTH